MMPAWTLEDLDPGSGGDPTDAPPPREDSAWATLRAMPPPLSGPSPNGDSVATAAFAAGRSPWPCALRWWPGGSTATAAATAIVALLLPAAVAAAYDVPPRRALSLPDSGPLLPCIMATAAVEAAENEPCSERGGVMWGDVTEVTELRAGGLPYGPEPLPVAYDSPALVSTEVERTELTWCTKLPYADTEGGSLLSAWEALCRAACCRAGASAKVGNTTV